VTPVALVILDGWGCAPPGPGNAVHLASTPVFDDLWARYPHATLRASGEAVGLPDGQMGNSEVGHLTIGSGRVRFQDLVRVTRAIEDGSFFANEALVGPFRRARERGGDVHLLGLVSYGGVHSHIDHLRALLDLAARERMLERTWVHAFTDGRDVSPHAAARDLAELPAERLATVCGRYYAMDRDGRWERTDRALAAIRDGEGRVADDPVEAVRASYAESGADLTTMTRYREDFPFPVAFEEQLLANTLAETLARAGIRQLHAAETEKYAHVTYFLNGGEEREWEGETRILVPSPRDVPSYDLKPEMSAPELADRVCAELPNGYGFCVVNFANPDMVGHTGSIPAVVRAIETVDRCLELVVEAVSALGGACLVTADHGNAEVMLEPDGLSPHTAHTTSLVPLVLTDETYGLRDGGELADLAPTVLDLLGVEIPGDMTGRPLAMRQ
jgi:2,3-bisphosphoglycerate-independent phosphoglycerate mutase